MSSTTEGGGTAALDKKAGAMPSIKAPARERVPTHPGQVIAGAMHALRTNPNATAKAIGKSPTAIGNVIAGTAPVTPEMASLIGKRLRLDAYLLLAMQAAHDLHLVGQKLAKQLAGIETLQEE